MCWGQITLLGAVKIAAATGNRCLRVRQEVGIGGLVCLLEQGYFYGQPAVTTCTKALSLQLRGSLLPS